MAPDLSAEVFEVPVARVTTLGYCGMYRMICLRRCAAMTCTACLRISSGLRYSVMGKVFRLTWILIKSENYEISKGLRTGLGRRIRWSLIQYSDTTHTEAQPTQRVLQLCGKSLYVVTNRRICICIADVLE